MTESVLHCDGLLKIAGNPLIQRLTTELSSSRGGPWLVGGAVRDILWGKRPRGFDFLAAVDVLDVAQGLSQEIGASLTFVDSPFVQVQLQGKDRTLSFARLSSGESLEENLLRRNFTINALALPLSTLYSSEGGRVLDLNNGVRDLETGILRPQKWTTITDDPCSLIQGAVIALRGGCSFVSTVLGQVRSGKVRSLTRGDSSFWDGFLSLLSDQKIDGARFLVPLRLGSTIFRLGFPPEGSEEGDDRCLEALRILEELISPLGWGRQEQATAVHALFGQYCQEILFFLLLFGGSYDRGSFLTSPFDSGCHFSQALEELGCTRSSFKTAVSAIYEGLLLLESKGFPQSSPGCEVTEATKVAALILFVFTCSQAQNGDPLAKVALNKILFQFSPE